MANEIKFMYNGIKINGKLVKGFYSKSNYTNGAKFCFYSDSYCSIELRENFKVRNDSDSQTDYFEQDSIFFFENDKYINQVNAAYKNQELKRATRYLKKLETMKEKQPERFERYYKNDYENQKIKVQELAA